MNWVNYLNNCIMIINSAMHFHVAIEQKYRFHDLKMHLCCIIMLCISIGQSVHRGKTLVLNQPAVLFFILTVFHLPPLSYSSIPPPFLSSTAPFIFPSLCLARYPADIKAWSRALQRSSDTRSLAGQACWLADLRKDFCRQPIARRRLPQQPASIPGGPSAAHHVIVNGLKHHDGND